MTALFRCAPARALRAAVASGLVGLATVGAGAAAEAPQTGDTGLRLAVANPGETATTPAGASLSTQPRPTPSRDVDDNDPPGRSLGLLVASLAAAVVMIRGRSR